VLMNNDDFHTTGCWLPIAIGMAVRCWLIRSRKYGEVVSGNPAEKRDIVVQ
jgi:hypothetical protein